MTEASPQTLTNAEKQAAYRRGVKHQLDEIKASLKDLRIDVLATRLAIKSLTTESNHAD
jgi:hypothetical protein